MSTTLVNLACNRPENGSFMGRIYGVNYGDDMSIGLTVIAEPIGMGLRFLDGNRIRVSRRIFRYVSERDWCGNWCLHAFRMEHREARRLLRYLRESGIWCCESGPTRLFHWFNDKKARAA